MKENPFRFNQVVENRFFCDREELGLLSTLVHGGQSAALIGPRRTGKTSLVYESCRRLKTGVIHADLMRAGSYQEVVKRLTEAALRDSKAPLVDTLVRAIVHLRPTVEMDPVGGGTRWTVSPSSRTTPDNVIDTLRLIRSRCGRAKQLLFMDEFQDLTELPGEKAFLAQMRSELQKWSGIPVLFAGSDRATMNELFTDARNPFYQSAIIVRVENIDNDRFRKFIISRFRTGRKTLPAELADQVLAIAGFHPNSTQKLVYFLWDRTPADTAADASGLTAALELIVRTEQTEFERSIGNLTLPQLRALKTVAALGGEHTSSGAFLEAAQMRNASSVAKALDRCEQLKILERGPSGFRFTNPFLRLWLLRLA